MVEFYASIGATGGEVEAVADRIDRIETVRSTPGLAAGVNASSHWIDTGSDGPVDVLAAGKVFGVRTAPGTYRSVVRTSTVDVVMERYHDQGPSGLTALNGEFVVVLADEDTGETAVVTDRIGALPGFWTETDDGVRITTNVQLLAADDTVDLAFDLDYLTEYFVFQRAFGVRTPLADVEKLPPGSVLVFDDNGLRRTDSYWRPEYTPSDRPYSYFVDEFAERIASVIDERSQHPGPTGLLLSGGSDSRLLAHLLGDDVTAYHMNDRENEEVAITRRIAAHTGIDVELLERDRDYYLDVLAADAPYDNFTSWFYESHSVGFEAQLAGSNLVTGLFCDILFRGYYLPETYVTIPVWNRTLTLPRLGDVSPGALLDHRLSTMTYGGVPEYLDHDRSIGEILRGEFRVDGDGYVDHGIRYPDVEPLFFSCYPLTNDYARDYFGTLRIGPRWSPFLDARMIDLQLQYPMEYMLEDHIVNDVIERFDPRLLDIPHGESGVRLDASRVTHELAIQVRSKLERIRRSVYPQDVGYATRGSWQDHASLFRNNERFDEYLYAGDVRDRLDGLSFVDSAAVYDCYEAGASHTDFYPLITLLETPIAKRIARS